ncbi:MAG: transglutaminase [Deltaproteobacteria bacterium HGW-Deltaproteobacteria-12]|jgi:transglutaminase-like putative cysteine protease|nr:MAG: transglutaminase [Deltaproteobacteria bacterium HGW-Deltaproteobacteria-12]
MHEEYLRPTEFIDSESPAVQSFAKEAVQGARTDVEKAIKLYYAVRDGIYYDPYRIETTREAFKASVILGKGYGYCVAKAIVLAAACRAQGIACRLHFADVRNHLTTERLKKIMQTDIFTYHGYNDLFLEGRWIKVTPTFNSSLCERFKVKSLDFDGLNDAVFHPFDMEGRRHMEYIADHGSFADVPYEKIIEVFTDFVDVAIAQASATEAGAFEREAEAERKLKS